MDPNTPVDTKFTVKTIDGTKSFTGRVRKDLMADMPMCVIFEYKSPNIPNQLIHFPVDKILWVEGGDAPPVKAVR